jgi:hypothetical protein
LDAYRKDDIGRNKETQLLEAAVCISSKANKIATACIMKEILSAVLFTANTDTCAADRLHVRIFVADRDRTFQIEPMTFRSTQQHPRNGFATERTFPFFNATFTSERLRTHSIAAEDRAQNASPNQYLPD